MPGGRPTKYTEKLADEMLNLIAYDGLTPLAICKEDRFPSYNTFYRWLDEKPAFRDKYVQARAKMYERWEDHTVDIADEDEDARRAAVRINARQWIMSRRSARKYSDRIVHAGDPENPISFSELVKKASDGE